MARAAGKPVADGRIMLKNPNTGQDDATIALKFYEPVRAAILQAIEASDEVAFSDLRDEVGKRTPAKLWENASLGWYTTAVKLDVEARGLISRHGSPQVLRLTEAGQAALRAL